MHTKFDFFAGNVSCLYGCKSPASPALYFTAPQTACRKMPGHLYSEVGERYLLHGTSPDHLLDILQQGFSEKLASLKGMFGAGNYFAEAPASWPIILVDFVRCWTTWEMSGNAWNWWPGIPATPTQLIAVEKTSSSDPRRACGWVMKPRRKLINIHGQMRVWKHLA